MLERVYDTLRGILYHELPKNAKDQIVIFVQVYHILKFYFLRHFDSLKIV
jgi:hypothetical protein